MRPTDHPTDPRARRHRHALRISNEVLDAWSRTAGPTPLSGWARRVAARFRIGRPAPPPNVTPFRRGGDLPLS